MGMRKTEIDAGAGFDYYYGTEAEQFAFYQVPRLLVKDARFKGLSSDAKLLYGLMLDRLGLSIHVESERGRGTKVFLGIAQEASQLND